LITSFYFAVSVQIPASRIVAAIFLELAFTAEIRVMLSQQSAPGMSVDTLLLKLINSSSSFFIIIITGIINK